jgi:N-methylhydantoinase A
MCIRLAQGADQLRVCAAGGLRVGPESAGADPGPAAYGKGELPTLTDAHLVLGHSAAAGVRLRARGG